MSPLNVSRVPNAADVPAGAIVNVTTEEQRRRLRLGLGFMLLLSAAAGATGGYLFGRRSRRSNPRRKRRRS